MDLKYVKDLIQILEKSGVQKLSIREKNGTEITLEKPSLAVTPPAASTLAPTVSHAPPLSMPPKRDSSAVAKPPELQEGEEKSLQIANCVKSPMVGTFYRSETPESKPFAQEGESVQKGDVLCIIEAMKVMNEIKSDRAGVIQKILIQNGCPVEFGQPLFEIV